MIPRMKLTERQLQWFGQWVKQGCPLPKQFVVIPPGHFTAAEDQKGISWPKE